MKNIRHFLIILLAISLLAGCSVTPTKEEESTNMVTRTIDNRYFIFRIWNFTLNNQNAFEKIVDTAEESGFNAIKIHIPWTWVESKDGVYNFTKFDRMIDYVVNTKQMPVAISLDLTRLSNDKVVPTSEVMMSRDGKLSCEGVGGNRTQISFASDVAMDKAVAFYKEAVNHIEEQFGATGKILFYLPAFSQYCETEYWCKYEFDYSDNAINKFHSYLENKYGTIQKANKALDLNAETFEDIEAPSVNDTSALGTDWYNFRHDLLKSAVDRLNEAQKEVAPNSKFAVQFGSVFDDAIKLRCTVGFADICENVDVVWCDDSPLYNHKFAMSYVWSVLPENVEFAQEIDGPDQNGASLENYLKQGNESFACGCKYVSIANWSIGANFNKYLPVWNEISETWLTRETPEAMDSYSVLYPDQEPEIIKTTLSEIFKNGTSDIMSKYDDLLESGKPAIIFVEDDLIE